METRPPRPCRVGKNPLPRVSSNHSEARSGTLTRSPARKTASMSPRVCLVSSRLAGVLTIAWWSLVSRMVEAWPALSAGASSKEPDAANSPPEVLTMRYGVLEEKRAVFAVGLPVLLSRGA